MQPDLDVLAALPPMTASDLRTALRARQMTQAQAARLFGVTERALNAWVRGAVRVPRAVALVLALWP